MANWGRDTPWRQGHFLNRQTAEKLGLIGVDQFDKECVVISHDCDLTQLPDAEPTVEVITACRVDKLDGNLTLAKNARRLQLKATINGAPVFFELTAVGKGAVEKTALGDYEPSVVIRLAAQERRVLQLWLAARYSRSAFPDAFDRRLKETGVADELIKILRPVGEHIVAIFFDVDEGQDEERIKPEDTYSLTIDLLYSTDADPGKAELVAKDTAERIKQIFASRCFDNDSKTWRGIELIGCDSHSDEAMSYKLSRQLRRWNADHMSLRSDPPAPILTV